MVLDEFLIALGLKVDSASINNAEALGDAVDGIADSATEADAQVNTLGGRISKSFGTALTVLGAAYAAIQATVLGAIASFNGYISSAEEYYNSKDADVKITKEQLEMSKKYKNELGELGGVLESIRVRVAFSFLPAMLKAVETFNKLFDSNKELIANGLSKFLNALAYISQAVINTIRFIDMVITRTVGWDIALYALAAAFLFVRRAMILTFIASPVGILIAAIALLIILIDDFITYLDGGESEFGDFWGAMLKYIEIITPALRKLWDLLITGVSYLIGGGIAVVNGFGGAFIDIIQAIAAVWALFIGLLTGDVELIKTAWQGLTENLLSAWNNLLTLFEPLAELIVSILSSVFDRAKTYIAGVLDSIIGYIKSFVSRIGASLSAVFTIVTTPFKNAFDWIVNTFSKLPSLIGGIVSKLPGVNAISSIGSAVSAGVSRITNNYGGSTQATINVTAPNATSAANQTAAALNNTQAQRNLGGQALA